MDALKIKRLILHSGKMYDSRLIPFECREKDLPCE